VEEEGKVGPSVQQQVALAAVKVDNPRLIMSLLPAEAVEVAVPAMPELMDIAAGAAELGAPVSVSFSMFI
jgi:hypothetical protein